MSNTPGATTVLLASLYPAWWAGATTVELVTVSDGNVTMPVSEVELFPHGVATAAITIGEEAWDACIIPWSQVVHLNQAS